MGNFSEGKKTYWYSDARPEGKGNEGLKFDNDRYDQVSRVVSNLHGRNAVTNKEVKAVQKYLVQVGYLDSTYVDAKGSEHDSVDGFVGGRTHGAAKRYLTNFSSDKTSYEIIDFFKFWD